MGFCVFSLLFIRQKHSKTILYNDFSRFLYVNLTDCFFSPRDFFKTT